MIDYYRDLPIGHFPIDGCYLLVRDAWMRYLNAENLPEYASFISTAEQNNAVVKKHVGVLVTQIQQPEHLCAVVAENGSRWHCGIYCADQMPGLVIHTVDKRIKIETLTQFKQRFITVEYYKYAEPD